LVDAQTRASLRVLLREAVHPSPAGPSAPITSVAEALLGDASAILNAIFVRLPPDCPHPAAKSLRARSPRRPRGKSPACVTVVSRLAATAMPKSMSLYRPQQHDAFGLHVAVHHASGIGNPSATCVMTRIF